MEIFSVQYDVSLDVHIFLRIHNIHVVLYGQIHMFHAKCAFFSLKISKVHVFVIINIGSKLKKNSSSFKMMVLTLGTYN